MQLAKMMEEKRRRAAIKLDTYSLGERWAFVELMVLRIIRENPGLRVVEIYSKLDKILTDAKVDKSIGPIKNINHLINGLLRAGHIGDVKFAIEDDGVFDYDDQQMPSVSKKGRHYMLSMPSTVKNAASRIMQPYTVLDRIAAAIPKIKAEKPKRRRRRRRRRA